ncbi:hypothetical protein ACSIGC_17700 [Tenacibaculum sp. ZS6-P6]|uniref:hypothetical protein n=1 Tax=Tenacibaculum sp. ZS6-P6 TaxID=3447503 RepID=UPI003F9C4AA2
MRIVLQILILNLVFISCEKEIKETPEEFAEKLVKMFNDFDNLASSLSRKATKSTQNVLEEREIINDFLNQSIRTLKRSKEINQDLKGKEKMITVFTSYKEVINSSKYTAFLKEIEKDKQEKNSNKKKNTSIFVGKKFELLKELMKDIIPVQTKAEKLELVIEQYQKLYVKG